MWGFFVFIGMVEKVNLKGTYGYKNFISDDERQTLLDWVNINEDNFILNKFSNRRFFKFDKDSTINGLVSEIKNRVITIESISNWKEEPTYMDYIGINYEGGNIHLHTDLNDGDFIHTRYNVILSYPEEGGESIYGKDINVLEENMVWKCVAGKILHGSTPVKGKKKRITLSLGFLIK